MTKLVLDHLFISGIRLRRRAYFLGLTALTGAALLPPAAQAQSVWGGTGSSTTTTDYNLGTNWSSLPAGAPPVAGGQSAVFGNTGNSTVSVTAGPITPDSWTFNANSQSYNVSGAAVNFGTTTGLVNNASAGQAISIANNLGGAGAQLQQLGASTLTLTGTNTYSGVTTIAAGTLALTGTGSIAASSQVNLTNSGATFDISGATAGASVRTLNGNGGNVNLGSKTLTITAGDSTNNFYGNIGGSGGLTIAGGMQVLDGTNTYTGVTTVNSNTMLSVEGTGTIASSSKVIANGALDFSVMSVDSSITSLAGTDTNAIVFLGNHTLTLTAANDTFAGVISENGGLALTSGTQTLTGTNTYTGLTTIAGGTLALTGTGSIAASSQVNLTNSGATFDISGTTSGASIVSMNGVSGSNVNLGTKTLTITAGNVSDIYYGSIGGGGGLTVTGGLANLGGTNTYTGVTTINNGAHLGLLGTASIASSSKVIVNGALDLSVMSVDSSITSLAGNIAQANLFLGNHSLILTNANDSFAGNITGSGGLVLMSGTEALTDPNSYTGATTINGGTLAINGGSIATSVLTTVNAGGTLTGTGIVGNTIINSGGMFAPGNGIPGSSMTVSGTLAFQSGAQYLIALNPTTSSFANVTGSATLGGATVNATYAAGSYVTKQYTILTAGNVSGTFGSLVNTNLPSNFTPTLAYDTTHAYVNLALSFTPTPPTPPAPTPNTPNYGGLNGNQQQVGNALINFFNVTGGIPLVFGALTPTGLSQISGETATGSQQTTFNAMTQFMNVMTDPFIGGRADGATPSTGATGFAEEGHQGAATRSNAYAMFEKAPPALFEPRWSVWAAGFGGSQTTSGNTVLGSNSTTSGIAGTAVGADYRFSPDTIAGFALAGGGTSFSVANGGSGRSDLFQAGAFVRHTAGPAYISGALAYGWQDITTNRTVNVAGIDQLRAEFNANTFSGRVEGGYRFVSPWIGGIGITPYAAGQFTTFDLPAYAEQAIVGSNIFALAYGAKDVTDARSELGIRTDKSYAMPGAILTLRSRFAWAHDFDPDRSIGATFQTLPGASFTVNGAAQAHDSALTTATVEMKWLNGWSAAATFEGEFSNVTSSYAGKGIVRYTW